MNNKFLKGLAVGLFLLVALGATGRALYYKVNDAAAAVDIGPAIMLVRDDALGTLTPADGDYTRARTNSRGALWVVNDDDNHGGKTLTLARIDIDLTGGGDSAAIIAASDEIFVVELLLTVDAQCQLQFTDGAEAASTAGIEFCLPAYGGVHLKRDPGYRFVLDDGEMMSIDDIDGGTVEVRGYVWYYQE